MSDDLDLPDGGHRSVPPVVASLAVDPSTAATIAETFRSPRSAGAVVLSPGPCP